jgi:mono/diheme cytochrome c family protein
MHRTLVLSLGSALLLALAQPAVAEIDGKALYEAKCAMCHGKDGVAKPMAKGSANFNDPAYQKANDAAAIAKVASEGKNKMPAYKGKLSEAEIQAVAAHVKTLK